MGKFNELMIEAEDALRAVQLKIEKMDVLEDVSGHVEELLSIGDGGFLIMYTSDVGVFYFAADADTTCLVEVSEYDLAKHSSYEMTGSVPELMERLNEVQ